MDVAPEKILEHGRQQDAADADQADQESDRKSEAAQGKSRSHRHKLRRRATGRHVSGTLPT
jgi:hypothetical protein